jgi:hypothetical protein
MAGARPSYSSTSRNRRHRNASDDPSSIGPPSSFRTTTPVQAKPQIPEVRQPFGLDGTDGADDSALDTAHAIRREISLVEAEGRRLLDAFDGLELGALTRKAKVNGAGPSKTATATAAAAAGMGDWTLVPERAALSVHSRSSSKGKSRERDGGREGGSMRGSNRERERLPLVAQPITMARRPSLSSISSRVRDRLGGSGGSGGSGSGGSTPREGVSTGATLSPSPLRLTVGLGRMASGSRSSVLLGTPGSGNIGLPPVGEDREDGESDEEESYVNYGRHVRNGSAGGASGASVRSRDGSTRTGSVARSGRANGYTNGHANGSINSSANGHANGKAGHPSLGPNSDSDPNADIRALEAEMADIRARRTQVTARYAARLEYLKAKLKSAEMREQLRRK